MRSVRMVRWFVALICMGVPALAFAAVQIVQVLGGLASPVFVGNARAGSNRFFVVEAGRTIRVDHPDAAAGTPYSTPRNPFSGSAGRKEILTYGMRNPWRFSFDRLTGQQWVADVGQGAREEVDTPIVKGGNYGWRVYEGNACTN